MLTNKGKYGLKAMVYLAGLQPSQPALVLDIAGHNNIPKKFLESILAELRNAGLVRSKKGRGGGYELARPPNDIKIGQIVRVLDGPLAPIRCASPNYYEQCLDCIDEAACAVHIMMVEVRNAIAQILDNRSLAELRARAMGNVKRAAQPTKASSRSEQSHGTVKLKSKSVAARPAPKAKASTTAATRRKTGSRRRREH